MLKKIGGGNAYWAKYWIWIKGPGLLGSLCTPETGYFHDKTKISEAHLWGNLLLKILQEETHLAFPIWAKLRTKFNLKVQDLKYVLDLACK